MLFRSGHEEHSPGADAYGRTAVRIAPQSRLAQLLEAPPTVACHHHQAVRSHPGLTAVGWADDGLLEAVEDPHHRFRIAVQWHPEVDADRGLFAGLVAAARVWAQERDRLNAPGTRSTC